MKWIKKLAQWALLLPLLFCTFGYTNDILKAEKFIEPNVSFWINIYSKYDNHTGVVHDSKYIDKVYEVVDLRSAKNRLEQNRMIKARKNKIRSVLLSIHQKISVEKKSSKHLSQEELRIFQMYNDIPNSDRFFQASHRKRVRFQHGQRNFFISALRESKELLPQMENIFEANGLPLSLTRLPFVESSFNLKARSKVGASGIWQFMRSTGSIYLMINESVDERNDPLFATQAAAELLKTNYEALGVWPLAVTAYNHGRKGVLRAVQQVGSESLESIIKYYRGKTFGFASGNFYACLLAAIEVEKNAHRYFPELVSELNERDKSMEMQRKVLQSKNFSQWPITSIRLEDGILLNDLVSFLKLNRDELVGLNPSWDTKIVRNLKPIPAGARLRFKDSQASSAEMAERIMLAGLQKIPKKFKHGNKNTLNYARGVTSIETVGKSTPE